MIMEEVLLRGGQNQRLLWLLYRCTDIGLRMLQGMRRCAGRYRQGCRCTVPLPVAKHPRPCSPWTSALLGSATPLHLMRAWPQLAAAPALEQ